MGTYNSETLFIRETFGCLRAVMLGIPGGSVLKTQFQLSRSDLPLFKSRNETLSAYLELLRFSGDSILTGLDDPKTQTRMPRCDYCFSFVIFSFVFLYL